MKNMGLSQLVLVDPERFPDAEASSRASGADDILANARVVATLEEALADCLLVLGTSARDRRIPWPVVDPREAADKVLDQLESPAGGPVALVFGREHSGLTSEELQRCRYHVHIPSDPDFSSLNLAAAVQVLSYELRMQSLGRQGLSTIFAKPAAEEEPPVTAEQMELLYQHPEQRERHVERLPQRLAGIGLPEPQQRTERVARLRALYERGERNQVEMRVLRRSGTEPLKAVGVREAGARGG